MWKHWLKEFFRPPTWQDLKFAAIFFVLTLFIVQNWLPSLKLWAPKVSYLASIETNELSRLKTFQALNKFNFFVYQDIVPRTGYRPIHIKEMARGSLLYKLAHKTVVGIAFAMPHACYIYLNPEAEAYEKNYDWLVIHEYLHCLGYEHVDNKHDVLYKSSNRYDATVSTIGYAYSLRDRIND